MLFSQKNNKICCMIIWQVRVSKFWSESRDLNWCRFWSWYFNAAVVFVTNSSLLFRLAMAMLWSVKVIFIQGEVFLHQLCQNMAADCSLSKIKRAHHNFALKIELCSFFLWFQNNWCRKCVNLMNNLYWYFSLTVKE